ncbi:MAG: hypothetical protein KG003_07220 [Bacteroidetes bacterium]|nr:hypothetical protein [Bacteroidota bacterium]
MSGGKLSPRQKMINMMYLVLIALLALNVSKEIIKAFNLMENSLNTSTKNLEAKNDLTLKAIVSEAADKPDAQAAAQFAKKAKAISDKFIKNIEDVKADLEANSEGRMEGPEHMLVKGGVAELTMGDNMEVHSNYFLLEKKPTRRDGKPYAFNPSKMRGDAVKDLINNTRIDLLKVLDEAMKNPYLGGKDDAGYTKNLLNKAASDLTKKTSLIAEDQKNTDGKTTEWVSMYLEHSPLAGVFALLSKYENDARALESEITAKLAESVNASKIKFDKTMAVISTPSSAVLQGQVYEADLILAAYDSKSDLKMTAGGSAVEVKDGVGKYKVTGGTPGEFNYKVQIAVPKPGGGTELKEAEGKYTVFPSIAAISADELNVFYVGLDNPISVAVAGVDPSKVRVAASAGNLVMVGKGKYQVRIPVRQGNECNIAVQAQIGDRFIPMGNKRFRIRNVPKPVFRVGAIALDKPVPLSSLKIQSRANAVLENFVYEGVKFTIQGFKFIGIGRTGPKQVVCNGPSMAPAQSILTNMRSGEFIMFTDIRAVGPGGQVVYLENAATTIQ